jgi:hypothetical protein
MGGIMQKQSMILLALAVTVGSLAHAAPLPPALLGEVHGILSYCESVDRRDEDRFEKMDKSFFQGISRHDRELIEKDPNFRANFSVMQSIFRAMPAGDALQLCKSAVK